MTRPPSRRGWRPVRIVAIHHPTPRRRPTSDSAPPMTANPPRVPQDAVMVQVNTATGLAGAFPMLFATLAAGRGLLIVLCERCQRTFSVNDWREIETDHRQSMVHRYSSS